MRKLHPGVIWQLRLTGLGIFAFMGLFLAFFIAQSPLGNVLMQTLGNGIFIALLIFYIVFVVSLTEIYARMTYNRWLYDIAQDGIKIEKGIIWKKYTSIPYQRIQNVDIHRGIIARIFGFSSLEIETAGRSTGWVQFSGAGQAQQYHSEGYIPAVEISEAEKIRDYLMKRISRRGM